MLNPHTQQALDFNWPSALNTKPLNSTCFFFCSTPLPFIISCIHFHVKHNINLFFFSLFFFFVIIVVVGDAVWCLYSKKFIFFFFLSPFRFRGVHCFHPLKHKSPLCDFNLIFMSLIILLVKNAFFFVFSFLISLFAFTFLFLFWMFFSLSTF